MGFWQQLSEVPVAQVLLSHDDLRNRRRYLNAREALQELLRLGALPVVNENDTVAVDELKLCLLYTSPSPRDRQKTRMPSSA